MLNATAIVSQLGVNDGGSRLRVMFSVHVLLSVMDHIEVDGRVVAGRRETHGELIMWSLLSLKVAGVGVGRGHAGAACGFDEYFQWGRRRGECAKMQTPS